jgi:hypothetical protein
MTTNKTAADVLTDVGRILYGEEWKAPMARMLGVRRESIRDWLNGRMPLPHDHPALVRLLGQISIARDELAALTKPRARRRKSA